MNAEAMPIEVEYSVPHRFPFHIGLFLAVNAIPDAYGLIDGPDCIFRKTEWVHGKHDWRSTLLDGLGNHRIVNTLMNAEQVIKNKGDELATRIRRVSALPGSALIVVCAMPHVMIIGLQYDKILRQLQPEVSPQLVELPSRSLDGDWLDGYAETLAVIAENIDVSGAAPDPRKVAIIGNLMDRTEEDQVANVRELERMLGGIGLTVSSVWLSGRPYAHLGEAKHAGTLLALPLGRRAAQVLAARTGARVIEIETPFGLGRSQRMLRKVGRALDLADRAERFIDLELGRIVPRLEWVVGHLFVGRRVAFSLPPDLFGGALQIAAELGMEVVHLSSSASRRYLDVDLDAELGPGVPALFAPSKGQLHQSLGEIVGEGGLDLAVGDSDFCDHVIASVPCVELGFPAHFDHALFERPHLGFTGWICFVDRLAQALSRGARTLELHRSRHASRDHRPSG
jgi:nitrogenase molybdenum-iron protein alpha/beta subunit